MKFSIIIPLYNKAEYIHSTIGSVLSQEYTDFEIIVVNDGSTDAGSEIVNAIQDRRIRQILQENSGVSIARNHGVRLAKGEWVAFLDADDWQHPEYLATLHQFINEHPEVDAVATDYKSFPFSDNSAIVPWAICTETAAVELIDDLPACWTKRAPFFTGSIAVRTALLEKIQPCFPVGESYGEDLDLWFRLAEKTKIAWIKLPLIARIWVPGGLSVTHRANSEAPFLLRMEKRSCSGTLPLELAASTLRFVDDGRIKLARQAVIASDRRLAFGLLWRGRRRSNSARWWITLAMATLLPSKAVRRWEEWRWMKRKDSGP